MKGMDSELPAIHCKHIQLEVILPSTRDVSINFLFVPTIHGTNGLNTIVFRFDKVILVLELLNVYHADNAMLFNF